MQSKLGLMSLVFLFFMSSTWAQEDNFQWLEGIKTSKSMSWVQSQNSKTRTKFTGSKDYKKILNRTQKILNSEQKITYPKIHGKYVYNFWQDDNHVRGILRRKTQYNFDKARGSWETVLDIDALARKEGKNWVYKGEKCLKPDDKLCMVALSDGGKDAVVYREFNMKEKSFVSGGFQIPEAKTRLSWRDKDSLFVSTDFGGRYGTSFTDSGYPRFVKLVKRNRSLSKASLLKSTLSSNISVGAIRDYHRGSSFNLVYESIDAFRTKYFRITKSFKTVRLDIPEKSDYLGLYKTYLLFKINVDASLQGVKLEAGSVVALRFGSLGKVAHAVKVFEPSSFGKGFSKKVFHKLVTTEKNIILSYTDALESKLKAISIVTGTLTKKDIDVDTDKSTINLLAASHDSDKFYYTLENFNHPTELYRKDLDSSLNTGKIQSLPKWFDDSKIKVELKKATSSDGTQVPYYVVGPRNLKKNSENKVLLYGYGGFEISMEPHYTGIIGKNWLEKGNVYVLAAIRGGGEYGPAWHQAAMKENKQRSYDDFIAIAEDLIKQKITDPDHLAIMGGSNGGLLVGAVSTQRPELFAATVCLVPLLDMKRYNKLLAGASWMAEYGNPDIASQWSYIQKYSPYQNLNRNQKNYPKFLFYTSTKDDRVHPGHARKMAAKMQNMGIKDIYFYENTEGGHAASANLKERAKMWALTFSFLNSELED